MHAVFGNRNPVRLEVCSGHGDWLAARAAREEPPGRHQHVGGYFAGHTHRNRVRHFVGARNVPIVEVASTKEYPGAWAEYRIYEGGYVQIGWRASRPDALAWAERTRGLYAGLYREYALGSLADRCFTQPW